MEAEGSLSFSQEPLTGPYPEPEESTPHPIPILIFQGPFLAYSPYFET
jgi:hypothetical protein